MLTQGGLPGPPCSMPKCPGLFLKLELDVRRGHGEDVCVSVPTLSGESALLPESLVSRQSHQSTRVNGRPVACMAPSGNGGTLLGWDPHTSSFTGFMLPSQPVSHAVVRTPCPHSEMHVLFHIETLLKLRSILKAHVHLTWCFFALINSD